MIETERRRYYHYSLKDKQKALQHWNELEVSGKTICQGKVINNIQELCSELIIKRTTLYSWKGISMAREDFEGRLSNRGRKPILDEEKCNQIRDWVIARNDAHIVTGIEQIQEYCKDTWDWQARPPWISKFAHQNKLSSHLTQKKPAKVIKLKMLKKLIKY